MSAAEGASLGLTCCTQIGVGPHPSKALAFVAGEGKSLPSGMCEASASVRQVLLLCMLPESSAAQGHSGFVCNCNTH